MAYDGRTRREKDQRNEREPPLETVVPATDEDDNDATDHGGGSGGSRRVIRVRFKKIRVRVVMGSIQFGFKLRIGSGQSCGSGFVLVRLVSVHFSFGVRVNVVKLVNCGQLQSTQSTRSSIQHKIGVKLCLHEYYSCFIFIIITVIVKPN
ncbi:hypothetical protein HanRHA438_Chr13g0626151 [Helianthus annuus]|nr:hypothetical protein HanRHA438_Chr13g0626151 [Helianthus annuus]